MSFQAYSSGLGQLMIERRQHKLAHKCSGLSWLTEMTEGNVMADGDYMHAVLFKAGRPASR